MGIEDIQRHSEGDGAEDPFTRSSEPISAGSDLETGSSPISGNQPSPEPRRQQAGDWLHKILDLGESIRIFGVVKTARFANDLRKRQRKN